MMALALLDALTDWRPLIMWAAGGVVTLTTTLAIVKAQIPALTNAIEKCELREVADQREKAAERRHDELKKELIELRNMYIESLNRSR